MSYNVFMLRHYGGTIIHDVNNSITYNGESNLLLNDNLGVSSTKIK
jgi:hypothetical protein